MTEAITVYSVESSAIAPDLTELEELNLKVAAIAGWTDIEEWHRSLNPHPDLKVNKRVYIGKNDRKELGIFVPDYASDLNAIFDAFKSLGLKCSVSSGGAAWNFTKDVYAKTPAIALCKLLLELSPNLPKSEPKTKPIVIEATFE